MLRQLGQRYNDILSGVFDKDFDDAFLRDDLLAPGGTVSTCPSPVSSEGGTYSLVGHSQYIHFEILNQHKIKRGEPSLPAPLWSAQRAVPTAW